MAQNNVTNEMPNYIFLDNWVLSDYTKEEKRHLLSEFIHQNDYTVLINGLSAVELYNPGWQNATDADNERAYRAAKFLSEHPCLIIRPESVFKSEIENFPAKLEHLPIELNFDDLPYQHRLPALLSVLRGEDFLLEHGIDIRRWVTNCNSLKATWLEDAERIIEHVCSSGVLTRGKDGQFVDLEKSKEEFLLTLDRRHFGYFSSEERDALGEKIVELFMGGMKTLPAIRFSSLCFWYAYIYTDKSYIMKRQGSDIIDFSQMSLIPYCSAFTVDKTMYRLVRRIMTEVDYRCRVYNRRELDSVLKQKKV